MTASDYGRVPEVEASFARPAVLGLLNAMTLIVAEHRREFRACACRRVSVTRWHSVSVRGREGKPSASATSAVLQTCDRSTNSGAA